MAVVVNNQTVADGMGITNLWGQFCFFSFFRFFFLDLNVRKLVHFLCLYGCV